MASLAAVNADVPLTDSPVIAERICSIAHFVEWPARKFARADSPFVIGVFGNDSISDLVREVVQDRRIKDRPVFVHRVMSKEEIPGCHILFISGSERDRLDSVLRLVRHENILTVGACDNFIARGGMINLVGAGNTVRLQISLEAAKKERLVISSKLLQLALPLGSDAPPSPPRLSDQNR